MIRLYIPQPLSTGAAVAPTLDQSRYLTQVMRLKAGDELLVFNGRDGEWLAAIGETGKKKAQIVPTAQTRAQPKLPDLLYCFAPLKHARLDYMVQKAVEMGAGILQPVMTQHVQAARINLDRMRANAVEAAGRVTPRSR